MSHYSMDQINNQIYRVTSQVHRQVDSLKAPNDSTLRYIDGIKSDVIQINGAANDITRTVSSDSTLENQQTRINIPDNMPRPVDALRLKLQKQERLGQTVQSHKAHIVQHIIPSYESMIEKEKIREICIYETLRKLAIKGGVTSGTNKSLSNRNGWK